MHTRQAMQKQLAKTLNREANVEELLNAIIQRNAYKNEAYWEEVILRKRADVQNHILTHDELLVSKAKSKKHNQKYKVEQ